MDENEGKEILLRYKDRKLTNYKIKFRSLVEKEKALVRKLKEKLNMDDEKTPKGNQEIEQTNVELEQTKLELERMLSHSGDTVIRLDTHI